jgi:hypothetical protein
VTGDDDLIAGALFVIPQWALNLPVWVPPRLAQGARTTFARELSDPVKGPIWERLLTSPRMRSFYEYLTEIRKKDGCYKLPAR